VGGDDHPVRAADREVAQPEAQAGAQVLVGALERDEVVEGDDGRARPDQPGAVDPRRVEDGAPAGAVGVDQLRVRRQRALEGGAQAADVTADPAGVAGGAGVERYADATSPPTRSA
jgi:hypothetical protein